MVNPSSARAAPPPDSQGERIPVRQEVVDGTPRVHREEMVTVECKRRGTSPTAPTVSTSGVSTAGPAAHEQDDFSFVRRRSGPASAPPAKATTVAPTVTASAAPPPAATAFQAATACSVCGSVTTTGAWHPVAGGAGVQCEGAQSVILAWLAAHPIADKSTPGPSPRVCIAFIQHATGKRTQFVSRRPPSQRPQGPSPTQAARRCAF